MKKANLSPAVENNIERMMELWHLHVFYVSIVSHGYDVSVILW